MGVVYRAHLLSDRLDPNYFCGYVLDCVFLSFFFFFFFSAIIVDFVNCEQYIRALFTVPQITLFSNFFIKNGSHNTIYTFKNYFATVFSVSVFSFSKNKLNPNTPLVRYLPLVMFVLVDLIVGQVVTLFLIYKEAESDIYIYEIIHNNFPLFSFSLSLCVIPPL